MHDSVFLYQASVPEFDVLGTLTLTTNLWLVILEHQEVARDRLTEKNAEEKIILIVNQSKVRHALLNLDCERLFF